jgi:hemerythrin-like domain-containing protein
MNILHALLGEHGPLRHQLDALRLVAPGLDDGKLRAATRGLAEAVESHAELEDELLFDPLSADRRMPGGPVDAMRAEHREIETLLGQVLAPPATPGRPDPQRTVARLIELVRHHFDHEENVLFPIAATLLEEQRLAELGATWAERRGVELRTISPIEPSAAAPADDLAGSTVGDVARR